jgi:hypothetical protein
VPAQRWEGAVLVIRVELWPDGSTAGAEEIARMAIVNASAGAETSDYCVVALSQREGEWAFPVRRHRRTADGLWRLIERAARGADRRSQSLPASMRPIAAAVLPVAFPDDETRIITDSEALALAQLDDR